MDKDVFNKIGNYYNALVDQYGHRPEACDYGRAESQRIKFNVLTDQIDYSNKKILDVGCGFADFNNFLQKKYQGCEYVGFDISDSMVENARRLNPGVRIEKQNILTDAPAEKFQIVTANGIFYLLGEQAENMMEQLIVRMFSLATETVIFNSLSSWAPDQEPSEFYADPAKVLTFCRTLSPFVNIRHDYHDRDFTVFLFKQKNTYA